MLTFIIAVTISYTLFILSESANPNIDYCGTGKSRKDRGMPFSINGDIKDNVCIEFKFKDIQTNNTSLKYFYAYPAIVDQQEIFDLYNFSFSKNTYVTFTVYSNGVKSKEAVFSSDGVFHPLISLIFIMKDGDIVDIQALNYPNRLDMFLVTNYVDIKSNLISIPLKFVIGYAGSDTNGNFCISAYKIDLVGTRSAETLQKKYSADVNTFD